ncbi:aldo/keto reductase [Paenibacillus sp. S02]|uniref:aldo/keto reductase n=1 Tax=Paenibacillus sp. S02 TaxID=2823904 RepID=UPI001C64DF20|nr:aldo/keto reductase [Paenibacillus sp. S02]QYK67538.1 1-deoxyxylulose-5-phosphate synthase YajO [Paenibacillus sp. S02]
MEYVKLGSTGLDVSRICLGCMSFGIGERGDFPWALNEERSRPMIKKALEAGINFFDTANVYSGGTSEEITGRILKENANRDEIVLASKVFYPVAEGPNRGGLSRKAIMSEIDKTLMRLGTDYVDMYYTHRWDYNTPIEETMEALHDVVKAGKARYIGASTMYAWQFLKAQHVAERNGWTKFVAMQDHYNLMYREEEREMLPMCTEEKIRVMPWSPLAAGRLARPWGETDERAKVDAIGKAIYSATADSDRQVVERVAKVAETRGVPMSQIALAWLLHKDPVTAPIVGTTEISHIEDAIAALSIQLTPEEMALLEEPYVPHPVLGMTS